MNEEIVCISRWTYGGIGKDFVGLPYEQMDEKRHGWKDIFHGMVNG